MEGKGKGDGRRMERKGGGIGSGGEGGLGREKRCNGERMREGKI